MFHHWFFNIYFFLFNLLLFFIRSFLFIFIMWTVDIVLLGGAILSTQRRKRATASSSRSRSSNNRSSAPRRTSRRPVVAAPSRCACIRPRRRERRVRPSCRRNWASAIKKSTRWAAAWVIAPTVSLPTPPVRSRCRRVCWTAHGRAVRAARERRCSLLTLIRVSLRKKLRGVYHWVLSLLRPIDWLIYCSWYVSIIWFIDWLIDWSIDIFKSLFRSIQRAGPW